MKPSAGDEGGISFSLNFFNNLIAAHELSELKENRKEYACNLQHQVAFGANSCPRITSVLHTRDLRLKSHKEYVTMQRKKERFQSLNTLPYSALSLKRKTETKQHGRSLFGSLESSRAMHHVTAQQLNIDVQLK